MHQGDYFISAIFGSSSHIILKKSLTKYVQTIQHFIKCTQEPSFGTFIILYFQLFQVKI